MKRKRRLLCLMLALCLLSACGKGAGAPAQSAVAPSEAPAVEQARETPRAAVVPQTTQSPREQTGYAYHVTWSSLDLQGATPERMFYLGDRLLLEVSGERGGRSVYDVDRGAILTAEGLAGEVLTAAPGDGVLWYCVKTDRGLTLCQTAGEGGAAGEPLELPDSAELWPFTMAVGGDGCFYLMGADWLRAYSAAGRLLSDFSFAITQQDSERGVSLTRLWNGQVVLCTQQGVRAGAVKLLNTESIGRSLTEETEVYRVYPGWPGAMLLSGGGGLYALDPETEQMTAVLDWIDTDVDPETMICAASMDQETIVILSGDEAGVQLGTLRRVPAEDEDRTVLELGLDIGYPELLGAINSLVVSFNQTHDDLRVHVVNYDSYLDGHQRLLEDAGDLDLVITANGFDQMALTDLRTLFDGEVGYDTLVPCVGDAFRAAETLTSLPMYFQVQTLVGARSVLGEAEGMTPARLLGTVEERPEAALLPLSNAYDALEILLSGMDQITDHASLLAAVRGQPVDEAALMEQTVNRTMDPVACLQDGSLLLEPVIIDSFSDLQAWDAALGEELVLAGYPAETGNGGLLTTSGAGYYELAIPSASRHPAEAWTLLKTILRDETVNRLNCTIGFPILQDSYDRLEQEAMQGLRYTDESGEEAATGGVVALEGACIQGRTYEVEPLSSDQAADFRSYLDGLSGLYRLRGQSRQGDELLNRAQEALTAVLEGQDPSEAAKTIAP